MVVSPIRSRAAFSLIELSIVLVILGLLVGGILAGQSLIRASELRAVGTEYGNYTTALHTFRDKYFALPGDMANATRFWGRMNTNADCVTNSSATVSASGVCDGNSDMLWNNVGTQGQAADGPQVWRQLAAAGLIEGVYSGVIGTTSGANATYCQLGTDCPRSRMTKGGWHADYVSSTSGSTLTYAITYGNYLIFGAQHANSFPANATLKPEEAWNIDTKLDDGKPAYGKVIARYWNDACATPDDATTFTNTNLASSYKLSDTTIRCSLFFRRLF